jgi:hypothetical protein
VSESCPTYWFFDTPHLDSEQEGIEGDRRAWEVEYGEASRLLSELLEFGMWEKDPQYVSSFRVNAVARWWFVPPQWRCQAFRSVLPDELPDQITAWHDWFAAVRSGGMRRYLAQLYLHEVTMALYGAWHGLQEGASLIRGLTNSWTKREHLQQLLPEIDGLSRPIIAPTPIVIPTGNGDQSIDDTLLAAITRAEADAEATLRLVRRWNRNVKAGQTGHWELSTFQHLLEEIHDPWIDQFFEWVTRWSAQGYGLFLD